MTARSQPVILIYQMGKVASQSWRQAVSEVDPVSEPPLHVHQLAPEPRARMAVVLDLQPPRQTIANRVIARDQQRKGAAILARVEDCRRRGETVRIITGIRDPVPRSISCLLFLADFYDHVSRPISIRKGATAQVAGDALMEVWTSVLEPTEPRGSFEWLARHAIGLHRSWFADELLALFGVDVLSTPFPQSGAQRLSAPGVEVLVYRVEDMDAAAHGHGELLAAASAFLGRRLTAFPQANTAATRRSRATSEHLHANFRLPAPTIDRIYDHAVIRHFYRSEEVAAFKARWRNPS